MNITAGIAFFLVTISAMIPVFGLSAAQGPDSAVDSRIYAELLKKYVKDGRVDYQGFKSEEAKLDQYLDILEETVSQKLARNAQFAFYINAYNAWTIKLILTGYPGVKSIKDFGSLFKSPWKKELCRIDGKVLSLDNIEHDILRPRFKDPRVHFAINCAAKSCPPLRPEPYQASLLDRQLNEMATAFVNDANSNYVQGDTLYVSSIFKWFGEDFDNDVIGFFLKYATGHLKTELEAEKDELNVQYLDYDWSLNGV